MILKPGCCQGAEGTGLLLKGRWARSQGWPKPRLCPHSLGSVLQHMGWISRAKSW